MEAAALMIVYMTAYMTAVTAYLDDAGARNIGEELSNVSGHFQSCS